MTHSSKTSEALAEREQQLAEHLTFRLAEETFAINVGRVREVLSSAVITRVPKAPAHILGVINIRGSVVPVLDLRLSLNMPRGQVTENTCIIILETPFEGELLTLGAQVDSVQEVIELNASQLQPPPRVGNQLNADFLVGMAEREERFFMILDIDRLFGGEELHTLAGTVREGQAGDAV